MELPATSGTREDIAGPRVTRDGDPRLYRTVPVGDLDHDGAPNVLLPGDEQALAFTGLGTFTLRTQTDAWMTIRGATGSVFGAAVDLADRTGDGQPETLLTRTWPPDDETAWIGVLLGSDLAWRSDFDVEGVAVTALSTRPTSGFGYRAAMVSAGSQIWAIGGIADDRGAVGGGAVAIIATPE